MHAQQRTFAALVLAAIAVGLHWPAGPAAFSLDDLAFVAENESIRSPQTALDSLLRSFPPGENGRALYRPLTNLSYALEWPWFGDEPKGYLAVNALLYGGVVLLLFGLLRQYHLGIGPSFGAALLFAVHPVHADAVAPASGRSELLSLAFSLLALLAFSRALFAEGSRVPRERPASLAALIALLAFIAAALSKETGLVTAVLLGLQLALAARAAGDPHPLRRVANGLAPFAFAGAAILLIRFGVLQRFSPDPSTYEFAFEDLGQRLRTLGAITLEYARLIAWPDLLQIDFYYERRIGVQEHLTPRVLAGWSLLAVCGGTLLLAARRWWTQAPDPRSPLAAALLGGAMTTGYLLPVSHLVDVGALMAERFLFAPSAGLALLCAAGLASVARSPVGVRRAIPVLVIVLAGLGGWRSLQRTAEWREPVALWTSLTVALPEDARGWVSLSAVAMERGDMELGRQAHEQAKALAPSHYGVRFNEATLALASGDAAEAERLYREMIASGGVDHHVWLNLAAIEARGFRHYAARESLERALAIQPFHAPSQHLKGRVADALEKFERYLARHRKNLDTSEDPSELFSIATACRATGDRDCERAARRRAREVQARPAR